MRQVFGGILLGIGILIAGLSGLCSLFAAMDLVLNGSSTSKYMDWPTLLFIGGIPFAIGFGMAWGGWKLLNAPKPATGQPQQPTVPVKPAEPAKSPTSDPE